MPLLDQENGPFKGEVIHRRGLWRSLEAVEYATLEWVDWFKNRRLFEPIGNIPPAQAEANIHAALETEGMAAQTREVSLRQTRSGSTFKERLDARAEKRNLTKAAEKCVLSELQPYARLTAKRVIKCADFVRTHLSDGTLQFKRQHRRAVRDKVTVNQGSVKILINRVDT